MDDDAPGFGVDFVIDAGASFGELAQLAATMESTEAKILTEAKRIEKATGGMINLAGATAEVKAYGVAATRELAATAREMRAVEKSGEALVRQLERQGAAFGKTREDLRAMRAEEKALAAERTGNTDLAMRIRAAERAIFDQEHAAARQARFEAEAAAQAKEAAAAQAAMAAEREAQAVREARHAYDQFEAAAKRGMALHREQEAIAAAAAVDREAQALREAKFAHDQFEAAARRGMAAYREKQAAQAADAASAERLRASTDPLYAATSRLNAEIAESTRLYNAGITAPAEYARQQAVLTDRLYDAARAHDTVEVRARRGASSMTQLSFQLNDVATMAASGAPAFQIVATQLGQIIQVAQMAEGGVRGFGQEVAGLALRFAPVIAAAGLAAAGLGLFVRWVNQGVTNDQLTSDLGKITGGANATRQELYKLREETVTWSDVTKALFSEVGKDVAGQFVDHMEEMTRGTKATLDDLTSYGKNTLAGLYAGVAGMKAYMGEISSREGLLNAVTGDPTLLDRTFGAKYREADAYLTSLGARTRRGAIENARNRNAESIGFNNERAPKADRHAEQLEREGRAIEAQIKNLYALAGAYRLTGAEALVAEARVKAESEAIKKRADIDERVARQIRLAIAQRVSDAAKGSAAMREQAVIQAEVNGMVAAGNLPAERAGELMQERIAELPLLAAIEVAQQRGLKKEAEEATQALADQRDAQARLNATRMAEQFNRDHQAVEDRLEALRLEATLLGAAEPVRARALALLKAEQEARAKYAGAPAFAASHVADQMAIHDAAEKLARDTRNQTEQIRLAADQWDVIADKVGAAGQGMAEAFGAAGRALGDVVSIYADYHASRTRAEFEHGERIKSLGDDQTAINRENLLFSLRSSGAQVAAFGDAASAAKGFFKDGSDGYKTLAAAEKAFRLVQFALSVRAIAQDAVETGSKLATSAARTAAGATEAVVNAIKSLPFPLNLAAGAATIAALASIGVGIAGAFGGGGDKPAPSNTGTGTVLGDADAQSESLKRAIDQLREVDTVTSIFARQMAGSLRSIDNQIGGLAAVLVRSGDVNASAGVNTGFKPNAIGSILGVVPLIGGFLSSLFGSKTEVVGSGLYGGAQSIGSILAGGFDAQTYSDVKKTKKFLGIKTGTSYSTQYGAADAGLEQQFTLILRDFASAIAGAAGPLGEATAAVQGRLDGFVVNLGKIDLKDLTGAEIQERLEAVFGAAADGMAQAAFPGIARFQKAGEGAFETLVRVASTLEAVSSSLDMLGGASRAMSIDAKLGLADQFDSLGDLTSAVEGYFAAYYTQAEQAAARTAQMGRVFQSLGLAMPATLTGFRQLVEAQDLTTAAGQAAYATLLQLAPAFADLQAALAGAKSAADVAAERADLERKILELRGDTAAIRALELAKLDASNRALQEQIYAMQDAQEAARAADELRQAWTSVGDTIMEEVRRIRGLTDAGGGGGFAVLLGRFNAANEAARGGDIEAAKGLPALSQALLGAAAEVATSRQELARVQAETAAALEATYGVVGASAKPTSTTTQVTDAAEAQGTPSQAAANDDLAGEVRQLREEVAGLRRDNNAGHAATAGNTAQVARKLDDVTAASGGDAVSVAYAA